jgi:DNA-binding GntR family transcriptional regulator
MNRYRFKFHKFVQNRWFSKMQKYKYQIFTSVIEEQIKNGTFSSGDRLPSVREIKEKFKLSNSSVQSGFDYLVMKGYVENRPRSGFFVSWNQMILFLIIYRNFRKL